MSKEHCYLVKTIHEPKFIKDGKYFRLNTSTFSIKEVVEISLEDAEEICQFQTEKDDLSKKTFISKFYKVFAKYAFPISCLGYIILMASGFLDSDEAFQFYMSLFMATFSLSLAVFFSDWFYGYFNKKISWINHRFNLKLNDDANKLLQLLLVISVSFILWKIMINKPNTFDIPILTKENIGNILTWLSIIAFSYDKSIS